MSMIEISLGQSKDLLRPKSMNVIRAINNVFFQYLSVISFIGRPLAEQTRIKNMNNDE